MYKIIFNIKISFKINNLFIIIFYDLCILLLNINSAELNTEYVQYYIACIRVVRHKNYNVEGGMAPSLFQQQCHHPWRDTLM